jgi:hypothetical protein
MLSTATPTWLAIVRRGQQHVFEQLRDFENGGLVEVRWDRREADRRSGQRRSAAPTERRDRRGGERRGDPPAVWSSLGFLLVPHPESPAEPPGASHRLTAPATP